jgi:hypothetical protein
MSYLPNDEQGEGGAPAESGQEQFATFRMDALGVSGAMIEGPPKQRVPFQAMLLAVLVVIAGGALYAMRQLGMGPLSAIAEPVAIDYDYEKSRGSDADHKKLLEDLNVSHVDHQVPSNHVQKNPFRLPDYKPELVADPTPAKPEKDERAETAARAAKERQERIETALATLKVHTVLSGSVPVARVGEDSVRVGDTILGLFTVTAIGGRSVDIMVDEQVYTLSIDDEVMGRKPVRKSRSRR